MRVPTIHLNGTSAEASREHANRVADVKRVIGAIETLCESISDQRDASDASRATWAHHQGERT
jgi:hypothetical protein